MKKSLVAAVIACCMTLLVSCEIDNSDTSSTKYREQIVGTRWELADVMDHNNEWQPAELHQTLDICEIWFQSGSNYTMHFRDLKSYAVTTYATGTYSIENGTVEMTDNQYLGIAYQLTITLLAGDTLEGNFIVWSGLPPVDPNIEVGNEPLQDRRYTIRMKRLKQ